MAKFVALYGKPDDVEGFEDHYRNRHLPLVEQWPHLQSSSTTRFTGTPRGGEPAYHLMFEAVFASEDDLAEAMRSDAMRQTGMDAAQMVKQYGATATMLTGPDF